MARYTTRSASAASSRWSSAFACTDRPRSAWYVLAIAQTLFVGGDVFAYNYSAMFGERCPTLGRRRLLPLVLSGHHRRVAAPDPARYPGRDWASLIDSAVVTIGLGLLSWTFLIAPLAQNAASVGNEGRRDRLSLADILVLGVAVRMAVGTGRRSPAYYMMVGALVAVLGADSAYGWSLLHGDTSSAPCSAPAGSRPICCSDRRHCIHR